MIISLTVLIDNVTAKPLTETVSEKVELNGLFTNNMVIQRDTAAPIWGKAKPGEKITVIGSWGETASTTTKTNGKWMLKLQTPEAGSGHTITVKGTNTIELKNVASGDVWVCSGQSNMVFQMKKFIRVQSSGPPKDVVERNINLIKGKHENLRVILLDKLKNYQSKPQEEFKVDTLFNNSWQSCTDSKITEAVSAVGFHFGHKLQNDLNVPIGLINSSAGGTRIILFTPPEAMTHETNPKIKSTAGLLFNSMIAPLMPFAIKGVIWYQGENDIGTYSKYTKSFTGMISAWRKHWGQGNFPFLFVQLAGFHEATDQAIEPDARIPFLRESQSNALALPNTGMASAIDVGTQKNIHPWAKQPVGHRLAAEAKRIAYGQKNTVSFGPLYDSMEIKGQTIIITFKHTGAGLLAKDVNLDGIKVSSDTIKGFAICGSDKKFFHANVQINGNAVHVSSPNVDKPVAVRYAWADFPICNLYNKDGFPTNPFRTDNFIRNTQRKK